MTAGAAAGLDAHFAGEEVKFVVDDDEVFQFQLEKPQRLADGLAGIVHEALGFEHDHPFAVQISL